MLPDLPDATGFNTQFEFSSTASSRLSTDNTTSWGYSTGKSAGAKVTLGNPDASYFSAEVKLAGKETHDDSVADTYDTYAAVKTSASTGFADHLFFTDSRHNVYYYPVIGQKMCPAGNPSCTEFPKRPLFVQFSGVDLLEHNDSDSPSVRRCPKKRCDVRPPRRGRAAERDFAGSRHAVAPSVRHFARSGHRTPWKYHVRTLPELWKGVRPRADPEDLPGRSDLARVCSVRPIGELPVPKPVIRSFGFGTAKTTSSITLDKRRVRI